MLNTKGVESKIVGSSVSPSRNVFLLKKPLIHTRMSLLNKFSTKIIRLMKKNEILSFQLKDIVLENQEKEKQLDLFFEKIREFDLENNTKYIDSIEKMYNILYILLEIQTGYDFLKEKKTDSLNLYYLKQYYLDVYTHNLNVSFLIYNYLKKEKINSEKINLILSALFHDFGKFSTEINRSILFYNGKYDLEKYKHISKHSQFGFEFAKMAGFNDEICFLIRNHHNFKNVVNNNSLINRLFLLVACDHIDAIISKRCYKNSEAFIAEREFKDEKLIEMSNEIFLYYTLRKSLGEKKICHDFSF